MDPGPRTKLLVGAPAVFPADESILTINEFLPEFRRLLYSKRGEDYLDQPNSTHLPSTGASAVGPAWRLLLPSKDHLPTGFSQRAWLDNDARQPFHHNVNIELGEDEEEDTSFLTNTSFSALDNDEECTDDEESEFLERSIALHDNTTGTPQLTTTSLALSLSLSPSETFNSQQSLANHTTDPVPQPCRNHLPMISAPHLTHLSHLPSASHLHRLQPQTLTTDLIASVITIYPARRVTIRRTGAPIDLIELLVGDETAAGFAITFWVQPAGDESQDGANRRNEEKDDLRPQLEALRRGDVLLVRNVALAAFRGKVQGQSLARRRRGGMVIRGGETTITVLWSRGNSRIAVFEDQDLEADKQTAGDVDRNKDIVLAKTRKVRDWTRQFVGAQSPPKTFYNQSRGALSDGLRPEKRRRLTADNLPPDESQ